MATSRDAKKPRKRDSGVMHPRGNGRRDRVTTGSDGRLEPPGPAVELVFGLVGPTGVDLTRICSVLDAQLRAVGYAPHVVRLSELIHPFVHKKAKAKNEYERIDELMTEGTQLRRTTGLADI